MLVLSPQLPRGGTQAHPSNSPKLLAQASVSITRSGESIEVIDGSYHPPPSLWPNSLDKSTELGLTTSNIQTGQTVEAPCQQLKPVSTSRQNQRSSFLRCHMTALGVRKDLAWAQEPAVHHSQHRDGPARKKPSWPKGPKALGRKVCSEQLVLFSGSVMSNSLWPQGLPGFPVLHDLPELSPISVHRVNDVSQLSHHCPLLLVPSIFPSIRVFSNKLTLHIRGPKHWSFSFSINPSNEYSGLISFRINWLDLFAVQGAFKSLLQQHSSKSSILWRSGFFMV